MNENDNGLGTNEREERDADITAPAEEKTAPFASPAGDSMSDTDNSAIFEPSSAADSDTADITASTEKAADTAEGEPDNSPESEPDSESDKSDGAPSSEISLEEIKKASANASPAADDPEIVSQIADIGELVSKEGKRRKNRDSRSLAAYLISFLPGFLCAGVLMFSIMSNSAVGIGSGGAYRIHFFVLCAIMAVSIVAGPIKIKSSRVKCAIGWVWWEICPAAAMLLSEWMIRNHDVEGNTSEYGDLLYCGGILPLPYKARFLVYGFGDGVSLAHRNRKLLCRFVPRNGAVPVGSRLDRHGDLRRG